MSVSKPFRRTCRQFADGEYAEGGRSKYILHPQFATAPVQYIRAFTILQKDVLELFEYIEPCDTNLSTYSYRTHQLLMRICIEIEANFNAILDDNSYSKKKNRNIKDYEKINATHRLSSFWVKLPAWQGKAVREPFSAWAAVNGRLDWYAAYNDAKHSRHNKFDKANLDSVVKAICGLVALVSAQFHTQDFESVDYLVTSSGDKEGFENAIGRYFLVKFPNDWPPASRYDFDWQRLRDEPDPFQRLAF